MSPVESLRQLLRAARRVLVFTGAGISTGSGIPDFRGPNGIWKRRQPVFYDDFLASEDKRVEYWDYKLEAWPVFSAAVPNATHLAIAELERLGRVEAVVTQNIDGLHQAAGTSPERLVEVHGTNRESECIRCGRRGDPEVALAAFRADRQPPRCACGGLLKMATISFGQALREEDLARAAHHADRADLALSLGSTLSVYPAAGIPLIAARRRVPYVVINRGPTEHDDVATLRIEDDVAAVLPPAVTALAAEAA